MRSRLYAGKPEYLPLLVRVGVTPSFYNGVMADSDNAWSAENQQERLATIGWVVGFVDGEGCFSVPIYRCGKMTLRWQVRRETSQANPGGHHPEARRRAVSGEASDPMLPRKASSE